MLFIFFTNKNVILGLFIFLLLFLLDFSHNVVFNNFFLKRIISQNENTPKNLLRKKIPTWKFQAFFTINSNFFF